MELIVALVQPGVVQVQLPGQPAHEVTLTLPQHLQAAFVHFGLTHMEILENWSGLLLTEGVHRHNNWTFTMAYHVNPGYVEGTSRAARTNGRIRLDLYMGQLAIFWHLYRLIFG